MYNSSKTFIYGKELKYILLFFILFLPITDFKYLAGIVPGSVPLSGIFALFILFSVFFYKVLKRNLSISKGFLPIFQFITIYTILFFSTFVIVVFKKYGIGQAIIRYLSYLPAFAYLLIGYYLSYKNKFFYLKLLYKIYIYLILLELLIYHIMPELWFDIRGMVLRTNMGDSNRFLLFAQEPSFVIYQLLLVIFLHIYIYKKIDIKFIFLIFYTIYLTHSVTAVVIFTSFMLSYFYYEYFTNSSIRKKIFFLLGAILLFIIVTNVFIFFVSRIENANHDLSFLIRYYYDVAAVYGFLDTYGIGQGIGQYSVNWINIFETHNIPIIAIEVYNNLIKQNYYLRPFSVILGILSEGGVIGFLSIMYLLFSIRRNILGKIFFIPILLSLFNAYSPAQPYAWLILGIILGLISFKKYKGY